MKLSEDDLYRTSTQFKHWSFTPQQLVAQRVKTNLQATERVKANVARQRDQRFPPAENESISSGVDNGSGANTPLSNRGSDIGEVDCLTADEEVKLVDYFSELSLQMGAHCKFPPEVTATCVQYLRRFYLYNSPMTYHGQNISRTAMFLACKTEGHYTSVDTFNTNFKKTTTEQILAPEYLLVQGLRFNFEVKHPSRGLKGAHLELIALAKGKYGGPNNTQDKSADALQAKMLQLPKKTGGPPSDMSEEELEKRANSAYGLASTILKTTAILTDAYFLYTPSQIWFAAYLLADEPLALFYLSIKVATTSPLHAKVLSAIRACASLLSSHRQYHDNFMSRADIEAREAKHKDEVDALKDKLKRCRDPEKVDLVKLNQAQKREGGEDGLEESKAKRRKVEREGFEKANDEFWGPELPKNGAAVE